MNPELLRNLWIELTPQRLLIMSGGLGLALLAAALLGGLADGPAALARWLYLVITVLFGTRSAALAVAGEIRARTWDSQRLSALGAGEMMWGKLLGAAIYFWYGGMICLVVLAAGISASAGFAVALTTVIYYLFLGVAAQATAFLASLTMLRRRLAPAPLPVLLCQFAGVAVALALAAIWPDSSLEFMPLTASITVWWGMTLPPRAFVLASLAVFIGSIVVGCYREMRLELRLKNGPYTWLGCLALMTFYLAGFDRLESYLPLPLSDSLSPRLAIAFLVLVLSAYAMVLVEPKELARYRWLALRVKGGHFKEAILGADAWMLSVLAALALAIVLAAALLRAGPTAGNAEAQLASVLGFLMRDISIFVLALSRRPGSGGDSAAVIALAALYVLVPAIVAGLGLRGVLFAFFPVSAAPLWLGPTVAWAEGLALATFALTRISQLEMRPVVLPD